jgi:formylglycine-generating enzyme required for sulfatase activity
VRAEASYGLQKGFLVSIAIERDVVTPVRFLNIHTELLLDWDGEKPSVPFDKIVRDLEAILGNPEPPDNQIEHPHLDAMVEVPAGEFINQDGKAIIEMPYLIDVYPVTNKQYEKFVKAGGYQKDQYWSYKGKKWREEHSMNEPKYITGPKYWTYEKWNQPDYSVVGVSYH